MARNPGSVASLQALGRVARAHASRSALAARYRLDPPLALTSRLTVEGALPSRPAIARIDCPAARPREISSRSAIVTPALSSTTRIGSDPTATQQVGAHRARRQTQLPSRRLRRLARAQSHPHRIDRLRRQLLVVAMTHRNLLDLRSEKCCADPLRPPACPRPLRGNA
jgi:hypothetical protein